MPKLRNATACRRALEKADEWLIARLETGAWADSSSSLGAYRKVPYLFVTSGRVEDARRMFEWVAENRCKEGASVPPGSRASFCVCEKAWVAMAAHLSGRHGIGFALADSLTSRQGQALGGVYDLDAQGRRRTVADVRATACAGLAFLACGRLPQARAAGHFLVRAVEEQTDEKRFHVCLDDRGLPVRQFPKEAAASYVIVRARRRTRMSYLGMPMIFLSRLHRATGEEDWLNAAMDYFVIAEQYSDDAWAGPDSGSLGWGTASLYGITRRRVYYDASERVAQVWVDTQKSDGSWGGNGGSGADADKVAVTTDGALCLLGSLGEAQ